MFRTDILSIIMSLNTVFTQLVFVTLSASEVGMDNVCPKHEEFVTKIKLRNRASLWLFL